MYGSTNLRSSSSSSLENGIIGDGGGNNNSIDRNDFNSLINDNDKYLPVKEKKYSIAKIAFKTGILVLLFASLSILAVTVSRSYLPETTTSTSVNSLEEVLNSMGAMGDSSSRVKYSLLTEDQQQTLFTTFVNQYSKYYATDAETYNKRLQVFKQNLLVIDDRNAKEAAVNGTAVHGVTRFTDLTETEYLTTYLMSESTESRQRRLAKEEAGRKVERRQLSSDHIRGDPTLVYVDWSSDYTTEMKNTGDCASSWAVAASMQVESDAIMENIITKYDPLSSQQIVSCAPNTNGCTSGSFDDAFSYIQKPGGLYYQYDYEYTSSTGTVEDCITLDTTYAVTIGSWVDLNTDGNSDNTEDLMRMRLTNTGPVVTCLDATIWSTYVSGTISNCDFNTVNHCVQVVGLFYSSATDDGFYKIRNVWGADWGIDGYVSVIYGSNSCGIANSPTYVDASQQR